MTPLAALPLRRKLKRSLAFAGIAVLALGAHGVPAHAAQVTSSCPGNFTVLHDDQVGPMAIPSGAYAVRASGVTCAVASRLVGRFLNAFDGVLPGGWSTAASGVGFLNPSTGASITLASPLRPTSSGAAPAPLRSCTTTASAP